MFREMGWCYMNNTDDVNHVHSRKDLSNYRLDKADNCLQAAKALLELELYEDAANRAYYCIFHSVRSLLALDGVEFKRHSGNVSYFREKYIKTGIFDKSLSVIIGEAFTVRSDSDYGDFTVISKQDVTEQVSNAELFYNTIKMFLYDNKN